MYWVYKLILSLIFVSVNLVSFAQTNKENETFWKTLLFDEINNKCVNMDFSLNQLNWKLRGEGLGFIELERSDSNAVELLNLNLGSEDSKLKGYYIFDTDEFFLKYSLTDCDTVIHYNVTHESGEKDTVFFVGYYRYLFDRNLLSSGQKRYFRKNVDSLISISGSDLPGLPELKKTVIKYNPNFAPID